MDEFLKYIGIVFAAALMVYAGTTAVSRMTSEAMKALGRQPELADKMRGVILIPLAMIEGATFLGLITCIIMLFTS